MSIISLIYKHPGVFTRQKTISNENQFYLYPNCHCYQWQSNLDKMFVDCYRKAKYDNNERKYFSFASISWRVVSNELTSVCFLMDWSLQKLDSSEIIWISMSFILHTIQIPFHFFQVSMSFLHLHCIPLEICNDYKNICLKTNFLTMQESFLKWREFLEIRRNVFLITREFTFQFTLYFKTRVSAHSFAIAENISNCLRIMGYCYGKRQVSTFGFPKNTEMKFSAASRGVVSSFSFYRKHQWNNSNVHPPFTENK